MAQIFKKSANRWPIYFVIAVLLLGSGVVGFFWYFGSPWYTDVGYRPVQPVDYSHKLHAGDLGIDCRYCHSDVERSSKANVPPTETCMNCHTLIGTDNPKLLPVRESWGSGKPIKWVRVHDLPDFVYFDHSAHLRAGVGCESCHGNIASMPRVEQKKPLSMSWCLDCHRNPTPYIRPHSDITKMNYTPAANHLEVAAQIIKEKKIAPPTDCSGCHR